MQSTEIHFAQSKVRWNEYIHLTQSLLSQIFFFYLLIKIKGTFRFDEVGLSLLLYFRGAAEVEYGWSALWENLSGGVSIQSGPN